MDLHALVNRERGVTNRRTRWGGRVASRDVEIGARALDRIKIAVPLGARHRERIRRSKLLKRSAMAVQGDVAALGLRNLQKIHADASEADRLGGRGALVGRRHFLEIVVIDPKQKRGSDKNRDESSHGKSLPLRQTRCKAGTKCACARKQQITFSIRETAPLLDFSYRRTLFSV